MKNINIAIDGPGGSGKGTTAKLLAQKLGYAYFDTGALYRCVALFLDRKGIKPEKVTKATLQDMKEIEFRNSHAYLNGEDIEEEIRSSHISELSSVYAVLPVVREHIEKIQKEFAKRKGVVMEGRDIGSVIMTDAELKIYLDASAEIRAKRRLKQHQEKGEQKTYEEILQAIKDRDERDKTRNISPLIKTDDAVIVDTSDITIDEQVDQVHKLALQVLNQNHNVGHETNEEE